MKITSRYYYDHKHQRWVIEHKVSQYFDLHTPKEELLQAQEQLIQKLQQQQKDQNT